MGHSGRDRDAPDHDRARCPAAAAVPLDRLRVRGSADPDRHPNVPRRKRWWTWSGIRWCGWPGGSSRSATTYDGARFFTRTSRGRLLATPLLLVLLVVEWSDLVFAIDSIPAIFAVTRDPFLVYSSNIFAILGPAGAVLRARRHARPVRLPEDRCSLHPRLRRAQDDAEWVAAPAHHPVAGCDRHHAGSSHRPIPSPYCEEARLAA